VKEAEALAIPMDADDRKGLDGVIATNAHLG
jgi:hypothetical protein